MSNNKLDKLIAKKFIDIYEGKASMEQLLDFAELVFSQTSLSKNINKKPKQEVAHFEKLGHNGEYRFSEEKIYINDIYEQVIKEKVEGKLGDFFNTYGHESEHHRQKENGEKFNKEYKISDEMMGDILKSVGIYSDEENMSHGLYLDLPYERGAREAGREFAIEVFKNLLNNKYINKNYDMCMYLERELVEYSEKNIERFNRDNETIKMYRENVMNWSAMLGMGKLEYEDRENAFLFYHQMRKKYIPIRQITKDYFDVASCGYLIGKNVMDIVISSKDFPQEEKDLLRGYIGKILSNGGLINERAGYPDLFKHDNFDVIFDKDDYKEIFENLLQKHVSKINTPLFLSQAMSNPEGMAKVLLKNKENDSIIIKNKDDAEAVKAYVDLLLESVDKMPQKTANDLISLGEKMGIKEKQLVSSINRG